MMAVKLTYNRPDAPPSKIDLNLEGIPYHTTHELKEWGIKSRMGRDMGHVG
jgi:hypothetical protein